VCETGLAVPKNDPGTGAGRRRRLVKQIEELGMVAIFGTASSSTYRRCGNAGCRCHKGGPKHGPHVYVSYRDRVAGKTTGYYVPQAAQEEVLRGIEAWQRLQECLRELAELNRERALRAARSPS
jgi:hypothetical protein